MRTAEVVLRAFRREQLSCRLLLLLGRIFLLLLLLQQLDRLRLVLEVRGVVLVACVECCQMQIFQIRAALNTRIVEHLL